jgi:hypothetical protein
MLKAKRWMLLAAAYYRRNGLDFILFSIFKQKSILQEKSILSQRKTSSNRKLQRRSNCGGFQAYSKCKMLYMLRCCVKGAAHSNQIL